LLESFGRTGRLDAEYYQPFHEQAGKIIMSHGVKLVKDICSEVNYGTVPTSPYTNDETGVPYIKGLNLKNVQIVKDKLDRIVNVVDLPNKFYTKKRDIIISQMGTVGDVGVVAESEENWLFASFTIRIRLNDFNLFNPLFVGFYIEKIAKPYYLHRNIAQASVRQNTDLPTIRNLYIPNLKMSKQSRIAKLLNKYFQLKQEAERLLIIAKRAVELAIEKDEKAAMRYIRSQIEKSKN